MIWWVGHYWANKPLWWISRCLLRGWRWSWCHREKSLGSRLSGIEGSLLNGITVGNPSLHTQSPPIGPLTAYIRISIKSLRDSVSTSLYEIERESLDERRQGEWRVRVSPVWACAVVEFGWQLELGQEEMSYFRWVSLFIYLYLFLSTPVSVAHGISVKTVGGQR